MTARWQERQKFADVGIFSWFERRKTAILAARRTGRFDQRKFRNNLSLGRNPNMTRIPLNQAELTNQGLNDRLEMSTAEIGLAVRTTNCLEEKGIFTVNDLLYCTRADLLSISNFGEKTLEEVYKALERIGFSRAQTPK
jgi:DNA-directed RNA polymerase subunit alpha